MAIICHAPWLLVSAGLARGRTLTSYYTIQDDIRNAGANWVDQEVVRDRNWVSSRSPKDLPTFNPAMIQLFASSRVLQRKKETHMAGSSHTTTDHNVIEKWAEARGGKPATVKRTEKGGEPGVLRINFPGYSGENSLEEISWDEWFQKFDEKGLAFLYQDETSGAEQSRFFKLVSRETAEHKDDSHKSSHTSGSKSHK